VTDLYDIRSFLNASPYLFIVSADPCR